MAAFRCNTKNRKGFDYETITCSFCNVHIDITINNYVELCKNEDMFFTPHTVSRNPAELCW